MKRILLLALPALLLGSCYPSGPEYIDDLDVVYTTFDESYDFQAQSTYALPDKIVVDIEIEQGITGRDTTFVYMKDALAAPILAAIDARMQANGWSKVNISAGPDVIIAPAAVSSTTYYYSYWYDWYYGGYYGGYWGWYYPPYYSVSSVTTGSLVLTMADPSLADQSPIGKSPLAWFAVANGVASGYGDISRVTKAIDQAFAQSPYLKTN